MDILYRTRDDGPKVHNRCIVWRMVDLKNPGLCLADGFLNGLNAAVSPSNTVDSTVYPVAERKIHSVGALIRRNARICLSTHSGSATALKLWYSRTVMDRCVDRRQWQTRSLSFGN